MSNVVLQITTKQKQHSALRKLEERAVIKEFQRDGCQAARCAVLVITYRTQLGMNLLAIVSLKM